MLWANIVKGYNPSKNCACKMQIHARTSKWNQTVYDPYVNMFAARRKPCRPPSAAYIRWR